MGRVVVRTVIVDLAIDDPAAQNEARAGVLSASLLALLVAAVLFRIPDTVRPREEVGRTLIRPVDPHRDHISGPVDAPLTIVEYGDFQCGFCLRASGSIEEVRQLPADIIRRAESLGLDVGQFEGDLRSPEAAARVRDDMLDAEAMDVTGVPTFFINGKRLVGPYDARSLIRALEETSSGAARRRSELL